MSILLQQDKCFDLRSRNKNEISGCIEWQWSADGVTQGIVHEQPGRFRIGIAPFREASLAVGKEFLTASITIVSAVTSAVKLSSDSFSSAHSARVKALLLHERPRGVNAS